MPVPRRKPTTTDRDEPVTRGVLCDLEVRSIDEEARSAVFVAATEQGVMTWRGPEHLRMSGLETGRYRKNPVVLDTHNRYEAGAIVGEAEIWVEQRQLMARVTFAATDRAEEIWQLVSGGFLRALSVGFLPLKVQVIEEGETGDMDGRTIEGPARIVNRWELIEISVVPVPADADAVRRSFLHGPDGLDPVELAVRVIQTVTNTKERTVSEQTKQEKPASAATTQPDTPGTGTAAERSAEVRTVELLPEERAARIEQARVDSIRAMAPDNLRAVADQCILEGLGVEDARKRLLDEHAKKLAPVGTPEPEKVERTADDKGATQQDLSDEELKRSLGL